MANVLVISETPQRVIIRDEAVTRTVKVVAQGPQGPSGNVNPLMFQMLDQAQAAASSASTSANAAGDYFAATSIRADEAVSSAASALASEQASTTNATSAAQYAASASASANTAISSASSASLSASSANTSATNAQASANTATSKASEAAASATAAQSAAAGVQANAEAAASSAAAAAASQSAAATSATNAANSATAAAGSATSASNSATGASTSATNAAASATSASASASGAASSATTASTKASEASTSAANAAASASAAAASATNTANALVGERSAVATLTNKTITGGTANPTTLQEGGVNAVIQSDIGTEPNQIPLNQYLGSLAYRDENPAGAVVGTTAVQVLSGKSFNDSVGIGTSSPVTALDVRTATGASIIAGRTSNTGATSEPGNFEVRAPNAFGTEMIWNQINAVVNTATAGSEASSMLFKTRSGGALAERLRIDASGNLGLGAAPSAWGGNYRALQINSGGAGVASTSRNLIVVGNAYNDNTSWRYVAGAPASMYNCNGIAGQHEWRTAPSGAAGAPITFTQAMTLDASGYLRLASGGIQFNGDTAAANALDDYEEGTFTPKIIGTATAGVGTYTKAIGRYTKVGNVVQFNLYLLWTNHTGTGSMLVADMPFINSALDSNYTVFSIFGVSLALAANNTLACYMSPSSSQIHIQQLPVGGGVNQPAPLDTSAELIISGSYLV